MRQSLLESIDAKLRVFHDPEVLKSMQDCVSVLKKAFQEGNKVLIAGNGGSAADAQHFATEIVVRYREERKGYPALALTTDPSILTATPNDYNFDRVFARQVEALGKPGDVFIGISTSGNSENINQAIRTAHDRGLKTVCLLGNSGGKAKDIADISVIVPSNVTARIQESQITIIHIICEEVEKGFIELKNRKNRLEEIVQSWGSKKILIVGDIMLDRYFWCDVNRISPEAPVPVAKILRETYVLGGAGNVANNLGALGLNVQLIGRVGEDSYGTMLLNLMKEKGIRADGIIQTKNIPSTVKTRIMAKHQQLLRIDQENTEDMDEAGEIHTLRFVSTLLESTDGIILSDYNKGFVTEGLARRVIEMANKKNVKVFVDPKWERAEKYKETYLLKPNKEAAEKISGKKFEKDYRNSLEIARVLCARLRTENIVITLGADGMAVCEGKHIEMIPTHAKEVFDVSGAGDTTLATLTAGIVAGGNIVEAAHLANLSAGVVVGKLGTAICSQQELLKELAQME